MTDYLQGYHGTTRDISADQLSCTKGDPTRPLGPGLYLSESLEVAQRWYARDNPDTTFRVYVDLSTPGALLEANAAYSELKEPSGFMVYVAVRRLGDRAVSFLGKNYTIRQDFRDIADDEHLQALFAFKDSDTPFQDVMRALYRSLSRSGVRVVAGFLNANEHSGPKDDGRQYALINDAAVIHSEPVVGNATTCEHCQERVEPHLVTAADGYPWCTVCPECLGGVAQFPRKVDLPILAAVTDDVDQADDAYDASTDTLEDANNGEDQAAQRGVSIGDAVFRAAFSSILLTVFLVVVYDMSWGEAYLPAIGVASTVTGFFFFMTRIVDWSTLVVRRQG